MPSATKFPDLDSGKPDEIWSGFFASHRPTLAEVRREILKLHNQKRHDHVIAALEAALINGQSQPWMYEVLALSMEIQKYPKEDVERMVLSMTDFGAVNFESMMYSAAYLVRFGSTGSALKLYRQASRLAPERAEPYRMALDHAQKLKAFDDITWAASGILQYDWSREYAKNHQVAEDAIKDVEKSLKQNSDSEKLKAVQEAVLNARRRDVMVELSWNGTADVDLEVEEPYGSVCSIAEPQTQAGGYLLNDGYGPRPEDCHETYVCPMGPSGNYVLRITQQTGNVVSKRVSLVIKTHVGTPGEHIEKQTLVLENSQASTTFTLENGRRTEPRVVAAAVEWKNMPGRPVRRPVRDPNVMRAGAEFAKSRKGFVTGAVGLQPIIEFIPEGAQLGATAIISPDRRYVRMAISPVFSNITDVLTFSFFGGNPPNANGQAPLPVGN